MARANDPQPGTLNNGRMTGSRNMPADFMKPDLFSTSEATKNGKSEGKTILSQRLSPFAADSTAVFEKIISSRIKKALEEGIIKAFK